MSFLKCNLPIAGVSDVAECKDGILVIYDTGLLVCVDRNDLTVKWIKREVQQSTPQVQINFSLFVDREDCIWIYGIEGVWVYDLRTGKWNEEVTAHWKNRSDFVHTITQDVMGRIWMGKDYSGIDILEKSTWKIRSVVADKDTDRDCRIIQCTLFIPTGMELYGSVHIKRESLIMAKVFLSLILIMWAM